MSSCGAQIAVMKRGQGSSTMPHGWRIAACIWVLLANFLVHVLTEFYIQFRVDRNKSLVGKIMGNDYYDRPEWRIYSCRDSEDRDDREDRGDRGDRGDKRRASLNSTAVVQCMRFTFTWPKFLSRVNFYSEKTFYKTHRTLDRDRGHYEFSDMKWDELPAELWVGSEHVVEVPQFDCTPEKLELYRIKTEYWLSIIPDRAVQKNLIGYLAAPDLSWAFESPNVTSAYIRAYVAYLGVVVTEYDVYMLVKDRPMKLPDVSLDWRGPAWIDWKLLKPAKKVFNLYRKKTDKMHGLWLLDPLLESRFRKMIPVLMSKMIDPCFLQDVASFFPNKVVFRDEQFLGRPEDMLCAVFCRFSYAVANLYQDSASKICYFMDVGNKLHGGQCRGDRCYCLRKTTSYRLSFSLRYCVNVFNMQQYNDTHSCRPVT